MREFKNEFVALLRSAIGQRIQRIYRHRKIITNYTSRANIGLMLLVCRCRASQ
ncbi:hypothetical protein ETAE_0933 [Edwardsiella piscicida]|uniref:Uncharacterized protein n=1 Tax=Edwardsiella piscicida TaxID=1263550 RepID=A0AAU8P360_EDWPI|nr:hypothetical protein ETAE_0933 [Edwardsiella tarda EIB202]